MAASSQQKPRGCSTICLPIDQDRYQQFIDSPEEFRRWLDQTFRDLPELFPKAFASGYTLKDDRVSVKLGLRLRRIACKATAEVFTIRPSFVLPYMTGNTDEVEGPLFLRRFGVPFWALTRVFGKNPMYWYRLEVSLGRNSIVGTTVRQAEVPEHLLADEHHQTLDGDKVYVATTVAEGCCLGASLSQSADEMGLTEAYGVLKGEALNVAPDYQPQTVNADGWAATRATWQALFTSIVVLRCFLHGWLNIRDRGKHLKEVFWSLSEKVWHAFHAPDRRSFAQRLRRLWQWSQEHVKAAYVLEQVQKLCSRVREYGEAYRYPGSHRTSNMLDRVMRSMNRYFEDSQHLHGSKEAADRHCRAWALLYNFTPWSPATTKANNGFVCPAERLNQHRYHDNWLENLLISASLAGVRR
jgi:hypothetical protein